MERDEIIESIVSEYDLETGFIGQLRMRRFDRAGARRILDAIRRISLEEDAVDIRMARHLYFIPILAYWQRARLPSSDQCDLDEFVDQLFGVCVHALGAP